MNSIPLEHKLFCLSAHLLVDINVLAIMNQAIQKIYECLFVYTCFHSSLLIHYHVIYQCISFLQTLWVGTGGLFL